jgi:hypothetical protein
MVVRFRMDTIPSRDLLADYFFALYDIVGSHGKVFFIVGRSHSTIATIWFTIGYKKSGHREPMP